MMRYKAKVAACVLPLLLAFAGCSQNPQANGASEWADTPAAADKPSVLVQIVLLALPRGIGKRILETLFPVLLSLL